MNDMYVFWMRIVPSVPSEINCLAKIHDGNADCMNSFENMVCVLNNAC